MWIQLLKGPGCQPQVLLVIPPPGRRDFLALPAQEALSCAQPSCGSQDCRGLGVPLEPGWGQGYIQQRVNVPHQAFVLLPLLSSLMLLYFWRRTKPKE